MADDLKARVEALELAIVGIAEALGPKAERARNLLEFAARETAKGKRTPPPVSIAAAALLAKLK